MIDLANNKLIFDGGMAEVPFLASHLVEEEKKMDVEGETPMSQQDKVEELLKMGYD